MRFAHAFALLTMKQPTSSWKCLVLGSRTALFFWSIKHENNKTKDNIKRLVCEFVSFSYFTEATLAKNFEKFVEL